MAENELENSTFSNNFLSDVDIFFLPSNNDSISNELKPDTKEEFQIKQQIKFISTKQETPQVNFLQKKTNLKPTDNSMDSDNSNNGRWTKEEQIRFAEAVLKYGNDWKNIQNHVSSRNITQVRSHAQKFLMKLKENNHLINKGLDLNLSWTKIMNYLNQILTYNELKEVLFSVEQTGPKKIGNNKCKNLKKIHKQGKKMASKSSNDINWAKNGEHYANENSKDFLNLNEEEDNDSIKLKMIKEEEEKELQKFIECFNSSSSEITLNSSFEEISNKDEEDFDYNYLNQEGIKFKKYIF